MPTADLADLALAAYPDMVRPAFLAYPPFVSTQGPQVADLCELVGFPPDPEQRMLLDLIFARAPRGLEGRGSTYDHHTMMAAAFEVAVICARQNLKTGLFKQAALGWMFVTDERLVLWSAHEFSTSLEAFRDIDEIITGSDMLRKRVHAIHRSHGEEAIELIGNRRLKFRARTKSGARGLSGDKIVLDEAFALLDTHLGALIPTLSARPDPQILYGSSAGLAHSTVLRAIRDRGRGSDTRRLAYAEWCDKQQDSCASPKCSHAVNERGCLLDDEERWLATNPAIGRRITLEHIRAERVALPPDEFARERMGWWDDPVSVLPLNPVKWAALADLQARLAPGERPVFGIDVSPGSRSAAIVAAGRTVAGTVLIDVVSHAPGTGWLVARAKEVNARHDPEGWALDPGSAAGALLPDLRAAGIDVTEMGVRDMGQACTALASSVETAGVVHREVPTEADPLGGPLTRAVNGAGKRDIGDGLWGWLRRKSDADICPIVAATAATWLLSALQPVDDGEPGVYFI